jgi:Zn-finger nucleic acid-binding protein
MIELIVTTIAINYVIFTLGWFSVTCKHWVNLAELHHKHTAEFELKQAEAIIREEAVNLAREIDNLTKKDVPKVVDYETMKKANDEWYDNLRKRNAEYREKKSAKEVVEIVKGFEGNKLEFFALSTSCYFAPDVMKYHKPTFPENSLSMN